MNDTECKTAKIRRLNDQLRTTFTGGQVVVTRGIQSLDESVRAEILAAVKKFDAFTEDNDPRHEHDFAAIEVGGQTIFFKIDYYDLQMRFLSPDPANPTLTRRVLTIMKSEEY